MSTDRPLAVRLASMLPARPSIVAPAHAAPELIELLAPLLQRPQVWDVIGIDVLAVDEMYEALADWAGSQGWTVTAPSQAMLIHLPHGACRIAGKVGGDGAISGHDAIAADRLPMSEASAVDFGMPIFLTGEPDRQLRWLPPHAADHLICDRSAATQDQRVTRLRAAGFDVVSWAYRQVLPARERVQVQRMVRHLAEEARAARPPSRRRIDAWELTRLLQVRAGRLALQRLRRDILAVPKG